MQTLIQKKPIVTFNPHLLSPNFFLSQARNNHDFLRIHPHKCRRPYKTLDLCFSASPQSLSYRGWDNFLVAGDSVTSGESNHFRNFLSSIGIADKKYAFVYLFGFVCALVISRVKVSTIIVFPACAVVFALGFSVGLAKAGQLKELRLNGNRKKVTDDNWRGSIEKLRNLGDSLKDSNAMVLKLKNGIRRSIECNQITVSDLEGYVDVIESTDTSFQNAVEVVESCIQNILVGNQGKEGSSNNESSRRRKKLGENGFKFFQFVGELFGRQFQGLKPNEMELMDVELNNRKPDNILIAPVKERNQSSAQIRNLENKNASMSPVDRTTVGAQNRGENFVDWTRMENIAAENEKRTVIEANDTAKAVFDQTTYSYQNKTSRLANNQQLYWKDYQDEIETVASHNDSYNSVDVSISTNHIRTAASAGHQQKYETLNRNYSHLDNSEEDPLESQSFSYKGGTFSPKKRRFFASQKPAQENVFGSPSSRLVNDLEFNRYLAEANDLLKEAKGCLTNQIDDGSAEHALYKSAMLLSKAIDMRPMSLLAVGQLGNTYLLHGELKLRMSRDLRSLLVRTDPLSVEELQEVRHRFDDRLSDRDKIIAALMNVCEECEELLIKAGRKYKLALSIDGSDMRALYNWGLALSFRAQLIADIGPSASRDADKIFLAAIDKFDAMMSRSNDFAPDALFRWAAALQQRSRLRPSHSREKMKLLQQAIRLYEDALHVDSENLQLQEALSSCISELDYWYC